MVICAHCRKDFFISPSRWQTCTSQGFSFCCCLDKCMQDICSPSKMNGENKFLLCTFLNCDESCLIHSFSVISWISLHFLKAPVLTAVTSIQQSRNSQYIPILT